MEERLFAIWDETLVRHPPPQSPWAREHVRNGTSIAQSRCPSQSPDRMGVSRAKFDMFSRPIERPIGGVGSGEGSTVSLRYR
jgi:hypothetical protein